MKKLLITLGFLLLPAVTQAAPALVQSAKTEVGGVGTTLVMTLSGAPTTGNVLFVCGSYSQFGSPRVMSAPDGTWTKADSTTMGNDSLDLWWHPVSGGDGTSYTFSISGGNEWESGAIYEISGINSSSPINKIASSTGNSPTTGVTNSVTPSVLGTMAISCLTADSGGERGFTFGSVTSGWTEQQSAINEPGGYHSTLFATKDSLTSDTSTPISMQFNYTLSSGTDYATIIALLAPSGGAAPTHMNLIFKTGLYIFKAGKFIFQ